MSKLGRIPFSDTIISRCRFSIVFISINLKEEQAIDKLKKIQEQNGISNLTSELSLRDAIEDEEE